MADPGTRVTFWGARGSIAVGGAGTARYGGATACTEIREGAARLLLDAGTGLRRYSRSLTPAELPGEHHLLLSHLHADHLAGFPFFAPLYEPAARVRILGPDQPSGSVESVLQRALDPAVWPLPILAELVVEPVAAGNAVGAAGFRIRASRLAHAGVTLGYRIETPAGRIVSYVTDNELAAMQPLERQELVHLVAGSDVLIHDATWPDALLGERAGWGHSSGGEAVQLGIDAGCRKVVLFHHDPDADDRAIARQEAAARDRAAGHASLAIVAAADGLTLDL